MDDRHRDRLVCFLLADWRLQFLALVFDIQLHHDRISFLILNSNRMLPAGEGALHFSGNTPPFWAAQAVYAGAEHEVGFFVSRCTE